MTFMNEDKVAFINLTDEQKLAIINAKQQRAVERYSQVSGEWEAANSMVLRFATVYRIKPTSLDIPWNIIKPEYKWAAMDENGEVWVYEEVPSCGGSGWNLLDGDIAELAALNINTAGVDWKASLTKRP